MNEKNCIFCKKDFSNKQNTIRHQKNCKQRPIVNIVNKNDIECSRLLGIIEEQKKENELLKVELEKLKRDFIDLQKILLQNYNNKSNKKNTTTNNTQNNNNITIFNTSQSLKDLISNLEPVNFEEMKNLFENNLSNKYIDKGIEGLARFICEVPCQNKFITTDYARKVITYKTSDQQIITDPKATMLLNTAIKQNANAIINKAEDRYQYWKSQVNTAINDDIEPNISDVENKLYTKNLKSIAQKARDNIAIDSSEATNFIVLKGMENKNVVNSIE